MNQDRLEAAYGRHVTQGKMMDVLRRKGTPDEVTIWAAVTANPGTKTKTPKRNLGRHEAHPSGAEDGWRPFRAEIGSPATRGVVMAWFHYGPDAAAASLEGAVEEQYGTPFAFEGDHVQVDW